MAIVERVALFHRELHENLSATGIEMLLGQAELLAEGECRSHRSHRIFFGSIMFTIDLERHTTTVTEPCDSTTVQRVARQMTLDARACSRIQQIAEREAQRLARSPLAQVAMEFKVRTRGTRLLIDVDIEGLVGEEM